LNTSLRLVILSAIFFTLIDTTINIVIVGELALLVDIDIIAVAAIIIANSRPFVITGYHVNTPLSNI